MKKTFKRKVFDNSISPLYKTLDALLSDLDSPLWQYDLENVFVWQDKSNPGKWRVTVNKGISDIEKGSKEYEVNELTDQNRNKTNENKFDRLLSAYGQYFLKFVKNNYANASERNRLFKTLGLRNDKSNRKRFNVYKEVTADKIIKKFSGITRNNPNEKLSTKFKRARTWNAGKKK